MNMTDSFKPEELIPLHGGYRHLKTFQIASWCTT